MAKQREPTCVCWPPKTEAISVRSWAATPPPSPACRVGAQVFQLENRAAHNPSDIVLRARLPSSIDKTASPVRQAHSGVEGGGSRPRLTALSVYLLIFNHLRPNGMSTSDDLGG